MRPVTQARKALRIAARTDPGAPLRAGSPGPRRPGLRGRRERAGRAGPSPSARARAGRRVGGVDGAGPPRADPPRRAARLARGDARARQTCLRRAAESGLERSRPAGVVSRCARSASTTAGSALPGHLDQDASAAGTLRTPHSSDRRRRHPRSCPVAASPGRRFRRAQRMDGVDAASSSARGRAAR